MGMDNNADLGYGFLLTDEKIIEDINESRLLLPDHLDIMWSGDAWAGEMNTFIIYKGSKSEAHSWREDSKMISPEELVAEEHWEANLLEWAEAHNIVNPAIGWWLCTSLT